MATHAASVAHELNTPLATLTLMVEELEAAGGTPQQREDYATLRALIDVCRDRVRELAAPLPETSELPANRVDLESVIERWQLVRPDDRAAAFGKHRRDTSASSPPSVICCRRC